MKNLIELEIESLKFPMVSKFQRGLTNIIQNRLDFPRFFIQFFLLGEAYDLTGDPRFLRAGRAAFERYLLCEHPEGETFFQGVANFGWLDPEFGGWLKEFEHVPTEPFTITGQTPDPDPANFR